MSRHLFCLLLIFVGSHHWVAAEEPVTAPFVAQVSPKQAHTQEGVIGALSLEQEYFGQDQAQDLADPLPEKFSGNNVVAPAAAQRKLKGKIAAGIVGAVALLLLLGLFVELPGELEDEEGLDQVDGLESEGDGEKRKREKKRRVKEIERRTTVASITGRAARNWRKVRKALTIPPPLWKQYFGMPEGSSSEHMQYDRKNGKVSQALTGSIGLPLLPPKPRLLGTSTASSRQKYIYPKAEVEPYVPGAYVPPVLREGYRKEDDEDESQPDITPQMERLQDESPKDASSKSGGETAGKASTGSATSGTSGTAPIYDEVDEQ